MLLSRRACVQHCSSARRQPQLPRHVHIPTRFNHQLIKQQHRLHASNKTETVSQQADLMLQAATSHFQAILDVLKRHDLEGLIPYMAELNVVKAVVRCVPCCRECRAALCESLFACLLLQKTMNLFGLHVKLPAEHWLRNLRLFLPCSISQHTLLLSEQSLLCHMHHAPSHIACDNVFATLNRQHEAQVAWQKREAQHLAQQQKQQQQRSVHDPHSYFPAAAPPCPVPGSNPGPMDSGDYAWEPAKQYSDGLPLPPVRPSSLVPDFTAILDAAQAGDDARHLLDSYAMRHLVLSRCILRF